MGRRDELQHGDQVRQGGRAVGFGFTPAGDDGIGNVGGVDGA